MMSIKKRSILFLGETYRADAITWMNGLKEFGDFEIITWELKTSNSGIFNRIKTGHASCNHLMWKREMVCHAEYSPYLEQIGW